MESSRLIWNSVDPHKKLLEPFVRLVKDRPALWNSQHPDYSNSVVNQQMYEEVTEKLGLEPEPQIIDCVKRKWKNLRDMYRKDYLAQQIEGKTPRWFLFDQLSFLPMPPLPNSVTCFFSESDNEEEAQDQTADETEDSQAVYHLTELDHGDLLELDPTSPYENDQEGSNPTSPAQEFSPAPRKKFKTEVESRPSRARRSKPVSSNRVSSNSFASNGISSSQGSGASQESGEVKDSNYHFLMSLLPTLRQIPADRKLIVWSRLLNVCNEELTFHSS